MVKIALTAPVITSLLELVALRYKSLEGFIKLAQHNPLTIKISRLKIFDLFQGREVDHRRFVWACKLLDVDGAQLLATGASTRSNRTVLLDTIPPPHRRLVETALHAASPAQKQLLVARALEALGQAAPAKYKPTRYYQASRYVRPSTAQTKTYPASGVVIAAFGCAGIAWRHQVHKQLFGVTYSHYLEYEFSLYIRSNPDVYPDINALIKTHFKSRKQYASVLSREPRPYSLDTRVAEQIVYDISQTSSLRHYSFVKWATYLRPLPITYTEVCMRGVSCRLSGENKFSPHKLLRDYPALQLFMSKIDTAFAQLPPLERRRLLSSSLEVLLAHTFPAS